MTDDNLPDTQQKCDCDIGMCTHRANCRNNPLKIAQDEMTKASDTYRSVGIEKAKFDWNVMTEWENEIWNAAIEAAAIHMTRTCWNGKTYANIIRKLKK